MKDDFGNKWKGNDYITAIGLLLIILILICILPLIYILFYFGLKNIGANMGECWLPLTLIFMVLGALPGIFSKQTANYILKLSDNYKRRNNE